MDQTVVIVLSNAVIAVVTGLLGLGVQAVTQRGNRATEILKIDAERDRVFVEYK